MGTSNSAKKSFVCFALLCLGSPRHLLHVLFYQQAQVYFAGASRYVGVFNNSHQANNAYAAFKKFVKPYKVDALNGTLGQDRLHSLMDEGRKNAAREVGVDDDESVDP